MKKFKFLGVALVAAMALTTTGTITAATSTATATATASAKKSSSENWDKVLDSYEKYVNKYIATLKKANNGDPTAMVEYASLLKEAEKLNKKLQKAQGSMTSAQLARYEKITMKMANAASNF